MFSTSPRLTNRSRIAEPGRVRPREEGAEDRVSVTVVAPRRLEGFGSTGARLGHIDERAPHAVLTSATSAGTSVPTSARMRRFPRSYFEIVRKYTPSYSASARCVMPLCRHRRFSSFGSTPGKVSHWDSAPNIRIEARLPRRSRDGTAPGAIECSADMPRQRTIFVSCGQRTD